VSVERTFRTRRPPAHPLGTLVPFAGQVGTMPRTTALTRATQKQDLGRIASPLLTGAVSILNVAPTMNGGRTEFFLPAADAGPGSER
jgi:hypothetical protein